MGRPLLPVLLALVAAARGQYSYSPDCADYPATEHGMCADGAAGDAACAQRCSTAEDPKNPGGGRCDHALCMCDGGALAGVYNPVTEWLSSCGGAAIEGDPYYWTYNHFGFPSARNGRHILTRSTSDADFGPITVYNNNVCKSGDCSALRGGTAYIQMIEVKIFTTEQLVQFDFQRDGSGTIQIVVTVNGDAVTLPHSYANGGGDEFFTIYRHSINNVAIDTSVGVRVMCYAASGSMSVTAPRTARYEYKLEGVLGILRRLHVNPATFTMRNGTVVDAMTLYRTLSPDVWIAEWTVAEETEPEETTRQHSDNREKRCNNPGVQRRVRALCKGKLARLAAQCKRGPYETAYGRRLKEAGDRRALAKHQRELNKIAPGVVKRRLELAMESCATDVCGSDNPCNAVANFESFCASMKANVDFDKYHTANFCPRRQCPAASTWHDCAGCQPACGDETGGDRELGCAKQCLGAGCLCNKGRYFSEEQQQCVRANKCP